MSLRLTRVAASAVLRWIPLVFLSVRMLDLCTVTYVLRPSIFSGSPSLYMYVCMCLSERVTVCVPISACHNVLLFGFRIARTFFFSSFNGTSYVCIPFLQTTCFLNKFSFEVPLTLTNEVDVEFQKNQLHM